MKRNSFYTRLASWTLLFVSAAASPTLPSSQAGTPAAVPFTRLQTINRALSLDSWHYVQVDGIRSAAGVGLNFGDIDGDGRSDIVSGRYWYRNPGGDLTANWTRFELPAGMDGVLAVDADSDNYVDILAEGPINGSAEAGVYWLRNNGRGTRWSPVLIGELPRVPADFDGQGYVLASIMGRHVPEIILTSGLGAYYFEVPVNPFAGNWPRTLISPDIADNAIAAADINHDGKPDVVGFADRGGTLISWWENPGTGAAGWLRHDVGVTSGSPGGRIAVADLDHDGRPDIIVSEANLTASHNSLIWFAQPADLRDGTWIRRTIAADQGSLNSLDVADVNGDGKIDVITAEYRGRLTVSVWENVNNATRFAQHIVDTGQESFLGARVADLDRDGAPDIVSIARDTYPLLHLWRNDALSLNRPAAETSFRINNVSTSAASDPTASVTSAVSATTAPTLVQHVSGSNAQQQITFYKLPLPNKVLPGNCVIVGVRKDADNATVTVTDDQSNVYTAGPRVSDGTRSVALYYSLNITNAPGAIRVSFSGQGSYWVSVVASEFYNVAAASAADGSNGNSGGGASLTSNNIATTVDGDLIYNYAAVSADDTSTEMSSWTPGSGYTLLSADLFDKDAAQYTIQATHGTINPSMTMSPSNGWLSAGMALKAAPGGTAPRPGIHVDKVLHNGIPVGWSSRTARVQVPSTGNLQVAIFASEPSATITGISDSAGHTWASTGPDVDAGSSISGMKYLSNAPASNTNVVTYTYAVTVSGGDTCIVFDISGADTTAPFDKRGTASGDELIATSHTGASVTPSTSNGLVISVNAVESNTVIAVAPEILMASTTIPETSPWPDDENNGYAIQYNVDTTTITSSWTSDGPVGGWTEILAAFKAAPVTDTTPPGVSITAPASGASLSGNVSVIAAASDNVGVVGVQFQLDGVNLGAEVTAAPYSLLWDTTTTTNGPHTLTAIARDAAGNHTTSGAVAVTVDNVPPSVSITSPAGGAFVTGAISVSAIASDNIGVLGVQFQLDGVNLGVEVTAVPYSVSWNTATATNGSHTLTAVTRDAAGNRTTSGPVTVTVDTTPPTVSINNPAGGVFVTGNVTVSASASDNTAVAGVQFQLDGANLGAEVTAPPYVVFWNTTTATNGSHTLTAIARDAAGNRTTPGAVMVTVDTTAPVVASTGPAGNVSVSGTIPVTATASDNFGVAGVQFKLDGANLGLEVTSPPYTVAWNTTTAADGRHTLTAVARDAAGNLTTSAAVSVLVANSILFLQAGGISNDAADVTISRTLDQATTTGSLIVAAVSWASAGTINCSDSQGNAYAAVPVQYDPINNRSLGICYAPNVTGGADTVTVTFSAAAPVRRLLIHEYAGAAANGVLDVTAQNMADGTTDPDNVTTTQTITTAAADLIFGAVLDASGMTAVQAGTGFTLRSSVNGTDLASEDRVQAAAGSTAATWTFASAQHYLAQLVAFRHAIPVDTTPPAAGITSPPAGSMLSGTVTISATASDDVGVVGVQFQLDGVNLGAEVAAPPYSVLWDTTGAANVSHILTAIARDAAGNHTTSTAVTVTVDNIAPALSLTSPGNGAALSGTVSVSANASDNAGVVGVQFQLDGVNLGAEVPSSPYSVSWNTTTAPTGSHTLTAIARDAAGNRTTSNAVTVAVDNTAPTVSITSPANGAFRTGTISVSATAFDSVGVVGVQFQLDGANLGAEVSSAPYSISWDTTTATNGSHTLTAIARDAAGNRTTSGGVMVTVDTIRPAVSITSPANGAFVTGTITVSATASDNVGVVGVQFQLDGVNLGAELMSPPYSVAWNTTTATNGSHTLTAIARDAAGNRATSGMVSVTVDATPPAVSVTAPANGVTVSGTVTISAAASDNVGVVGVQFQLDGVNLGAEVTAAPYSIPWNTTTATNGSRTLTAIARDAAGNRTTSTAVAVTVSNIIVAFAQGSGATSDNGSGTIAKAFPAATAAGDLIVAAISWGSNATVSCSDSQGNTYAVATTQYDSTKQQSLAICYAANIKGGADTITATFSATASFRRLLIHEYRGITLTGAVDVVAKNIANGSTTPNAITSTAAITTASGDLVFGAVMDDTGVNNIAAGTGFTPRQSVNNKDLFSEDLVQAASGSIAAAFTFSAAHRYLAQMVTFRHR